MTKKLRWTPIDDLGQQEADDKPFRFIAWQNKEYGELRVIRRDNVGGLLSPISDFSVYAKDRKSAKRVAKKIAKALRHVREYNDFVSPF